MTSVSIHAPTRGATPDSVYGGRNGGWFQSTHPHGVRHMGVIQADENGCFNPRTHTGCDCHLPEYLRGEYVSIHAPTRGATMLLNELSIIVMFQSTHPHGVRHPLFLSSPGSWSVSIHAPTRGATNYGPHSNGTSPVSIHAPTRGATSSRPCISLVAAVSIHAPTRGATICIQDTFTQLNQVSIHAPTRGATFRLCDDA